MFVKRVTSNFEIVCTSLKVVDQLKSLVKSDFNSYDLETWRNFVLNLVLTFGVIFK